MSKKTRRRQPNDQLLLSPLRMNDEQWNFTVRNLPNPNDTNQKKLLKNIFIHYDTRAKCYCIKIRLENAEPSRAIKNDPLDRFLLVSFGEFEPNRRSHDHGEVLQAPNRLPSSPQDGIDYTTKLLRAGVTIQGTTYHFYGHSNSQLKSRTCYLYAAPKTQITAKIEALGDFRKMKSVGKKSKRIGLLFATAHAACSVPADQCEDIPDIERHGYIFTDGCGLISPHLAKKLARSINITYREERYTPSVMQIRYRGYKGVVTVDPRMKNERNLVKMRHSMRKLNGVNDLSFAVVDYSMPFTYGFLNDESTILLHSLGISREVLLKKQSEYFQLLADAPTTPEAAMGLLSSFNKLDLVEKVLMEGLGPTKSQIKRVVQKERKRMIAKKDTQKCRIRIHKSRILYGVADAWDVLNEGECAVTVTLEGDGIPYSLKNTNVSVIRNPCLHPGDWQKLSVVERPELKHLKDCIVFSTRGERPAADMMSGGDLDGDKFFVCWDPELVPSTVSTPAAYPGVEEALTFRPITDDDRLVYFAKYNSISLGRIKTLYMEWAGTRGPMSAQCQELNRLFSQCVDGSTGKIPGPLQSPPQKGKDLPPFILDELHKDVKQRLESLFLTPGDLGEPDANVINALLSSDNIAMSEFDFIQLVYKWCRKEGLYFDSMHEFFDFNVLTAEQRAWVIAAMPVTREAPGLVNNALFTSNLISDSELRYFQLDHAGIIWKRVYDSSRDRLATFLETAATNMELFHRKLIVFRPHERLTLAIYVPKIVERGRECAVKDTVRLFAFPHSQGRERQSRLSLPTKSEYFCYCDEGILQLFNRQRADSWVYLGHAGSDDSKYRNVKDRGERRRQRQKTIDSGENFDICASVALNKFSKQLQTHVGLVRRAEVTGAEIYVISNRDYQSMANLDLWIEMIDTGETLPLLNRDPKEYSQPKIHDVLTSSTSHTINEIVGDGSLLALKSLRSKGGFFKTFNLLLQIGRDAFLLECYEYLLEHRREVAMDTATLLDVMLEFMKQAPFLAIAFGNVSNLLDLHAHFPDMLEISEQPILRAFILSASSTGYFIADPLFRVLKAMPDKSISLKSFSRLVELIALTVSSLDLAVHILVDIIKPESQRLLVGPPGITLHFVRNLIRIAIEYIGHSSQDQESREDLLELKPKSKKKTETEIEVAFRIDAPGGTPEYYSHVRLSAATLPSNAPRGSKYSIDALVTKSQQGLAKMRCFHPLPPFCNDCSWKIEVCGSFLITKSKFDTIQNLFIEPNKHCFIIGSLFDTSISQQNSPLSRVFSTYDWRPSSHINESQRRAVKKSLEYPLTCVWATSGPTKTETVIEIICALQEKYPKSRFLVTAATDCSIDKMLRRYLDRIQKLPLRTQQQTRPLRVSTNVRQVAEELRQYTCDALIGEEIGSSNDPPAAAKIQVKTYSIVFTTSTDAGCGLLLNEAFNIVVIDGASAQTEPASLIPLGKGCMKAILVGDSAEMQPTVQHPSLPLGFYQTLFERVYTEPKGKELTDVAIVELDP